MTREEITNSQDYKATKAALKWWYSLPEEQRKATDIDAEPDVVDAYAEGVIYGWNHPQWIPVEERLPEPNIYKEGKTFPLVLVCLTDGCVDTDAYDTDIKAWCKYDGEVAYWMSLPTPPQGKEDKK